MKNTIKDFFIKKKQGQEFGFFDESIVIPNGTDPIAGWLQDVVQIVAPESHTLIIVVLDINKKDFHKITRTCKAKAGCEVDWHHLECAWRFGSAIDPLVQEISISIKSDPVKDA